MARKRNSAPSLTYQIKVAFDEKLAIGVSKHEDKKADLTASRIYSWETYRSYMRHANYFAAYCKELHDCKSLIECRPYVDEWLQSRSELSAYTQKLEAAALAKLYGCRTTDFIKTASRNRRDITRSRAEKVRDKHFSETRNSDLIRFCRATGLRRGELKALTGNKLAQDENGNYFIVVDSGSKGGRYREVPIISDVDHVIALMSRAGDAKVFPRIHNAADIHSYRADYATAVYKAHARRIEDIPYDRVSASGKPYQSDVYVCRSDQKGQRFDKQAMLIASKALGHNRISVVGEHYLRDVE